MKLLILKTCCVIRLLCCAVLVTASRAMRMSLHLNSVFASVPHALHSNRSRRFLPFPFRLILALIFLLPGIALAQQTILVFGDSLSAAYGIPREAGWVNLLQQELQRSHPQYQVVNASISGETTSGGRQRIAAALHQHQPGIVIIELGANDGLRGTPVKDIRANLAEIIRQSRKARAKVLLLGMQLPPNYGMAYTASFKTMYPKLARQYRAELVPFFLDGVTPEQFQADNLHPVADAQPRILHNILQKLEPLLQGGSGRRP
jgi:acyl-CoA thioesterase-1